MSTISVLGAGAFGTSLALALSREGAPVTLWGRDDGAINEMATSRKTGKRLPGFDLPDSLGLTADLDDALSDTCLIVTPMQALAGFLEENTARLVGRRLVACCKGVDLASGDGPVTLIKRLCPNSTAALLTGPSFAADIAAGLPTAVVLASERESDAESLQNELSRPLLRLYRTTDVTGAELGGALKNVIALAAGMAIGAGLGESARASVIARGFAEIARFATSNGAELETLHGLSGLGDLVLTCTSEKSRNLSAGLALGRGEKPDPNSTVEGIATARAVARAADKTRLAMPLTTAVADVAEGRLAIRDAVHTLLARPVGKE